MKNLIVIMLLFCTGIVKAQEKPILVSPSWLLSNLEKDNVVILQTGFLKPDYDREHIEGARFLWNDSLTPNTPESTMNLPDVEKATQVLREAGVNNDSHIVLCHIRNEVTITARILMTLEHLGLRGRVSYLNGGLEAWKKEGFPVTTEQPKITKGNVKLSSSNHVVDKDYVLKSLKSPNAVVVDARIPRYYDGEPTGNPRDGHITGAKNIPYTEMVDAANNFKPSEQLESYFSPIASKEKEMVAYCFIGQTASVVYMAGRILGYNMKLYDGSIQEWSRIPELPMEKK